MKNANIHTADLYFHTMEDKDTHITVRVEIEHHDGTTTNDEVALTRDDFFAGAENARLFDRRATGDRVWDEDETGQEYTFDLVEWAHNETHEIFTAIHETEPFSFNHQTLQA